jgi:anti-sigma factor RsiW
MTMKTIENWMLHAYLDGELDAADCETVKQLLETDPAARAALDSFRLQNNALQRAFAGILDEPVPAVLLETLKRRETRQPSLLVQIAAALAILIIGGTGGWFLAHDPAGLRAQSLAEEAIAAHQIYTVEVRHPVEVAAADRQHLQNWLSNRVGVAFAVPDLVSDGYNLLGGRLLAAGDHPAAQLMYEDASKRRITIFLTANTAKADMSLRVDHRGKTVSCYWMEGALAFAVTGEMEDAPMMKLARDIYDKFET